MKLVVRNLLVLLFVVGIFYFPGAATQNIAAQGAQDFELVNATEVDIYAVYISPHDVNSWEEDILGMEILATGESADISFSRDEDAEFWDLRVEDEDGNYIVWKNLNLFEISTVTLHFKDGRAWADVE